MNRKKLFTLLLCLCMIFTACSGKKKSDAEKSEKAKEEAAKTGFKLLDITKGRFVEERAWVEYSDETGKEWIALIDTEGRVLTQYPKEAFPEYRVGRIANGLTFISTKTLKFENAKATITDVKDRYIFLDKNGKELYEYNKPDDTTDRMECLGITNDYFIVMKVCADTDQDTIKNETDFTLLFFDKTGAKKDSVYSGYSDTHSINGLKEIQIYDDLDDEAVFIFSTSDTSYTYNCYMDYRNGLLCYASEIHGHYNIKAWLDRYGYKHIQFNYGQSLVCEIITLYLDNLFFHYGLRDINTKTNIGFIEKNNTTKKLRFDGVIANRLSTNDKRGFECAEDNIVILSGIEKLNGGLIFYNINKFGDNSGYFNDYIQRIGYSDYNTYDKKYISKEEIQRAEEDLLKDKTTYEFTYALEEGYSFKQAPYYHNGYVLIDVTDSRNTEYFTILDSKGNALYEKIKGHVIGFSEGYVVYSDGKDYLCPSASKYNENILNIVDTKGKSHSLADDLSFLPDNFELLNDERDEYIISGEYKNLNYIKYLENDYNGFVSLDNSKRITSLKTE